MRALPSSLVGLVRKRKRGRGRSIFRPRSPPFPPPLLTSFCPPPLSQPAPTATMETLRATPLSSSSSSFTRYKIVEASPTGPPPIPSHPQKSVFRPSRPQAFPKIIRLKVVSSVRILKRLVSFSSVIFFTLCGGYNPSLPPSPILKLERFISLLRIIPPFHFFLQTAPLSSPLSLPPPPPPFILSSSLIALKFYFRPFLAKGGSYKKTSVSNFPFPSKRKKNNPGPPPPSRQL